MDPAGPPIRRVIGRGTRISFLVHPWKEGFLEATILVAVYPELNVVESEITRHLARNGQCPFASCIALIQSSNPLKLDIDPVL